jgi:hypothetical protein
VLDANLAPFYNSHPKQNEERTITIYSGVNNFYRFDVGGGLVENCIELKFIAQYFPVESEPNDYKTSKMPLCKWCDCAVLKSLHAVSTEPSVNNLMSIKISALVANFTALHRVFSKHVSCYNILHYALSGLMPTQLHN